NPTRFFRMADHYDNADRNGSKIYVGEYAVNRGVGHGNLLGALSEAVFMLDMEKNSDVVNLCSYAPLFENVNQPNWRVNLIRFDSSRVVGRSSYQVQKLFAENRPDVILPTSVEAPEVLLGETQIKQLYALAGLDKKSHEVVIKIVNPTASPVDSRIDLEGTAKVAGSAKAITLGNADATAENTLDDPNVVVPTETKFRVSGAQFNYHLAPNSLTVLRIPAVSR
ncbi:MAG TPA: alpha-L-arabinofuranosidase C-terminal domain-containing protein, partial [Verrucomicrobiae bacterium]|nr:alpha-L-arabinofuranosidase C-terminal domain-containing protein [Verrucomicrobiae bacterium]